MLEQGTREGSAHCLIWLSSVCFLQFTTLGWESMEDPLSISLCLLKMDFRDLRKHLYIYFFPMCQRFRNSQTKNSLKSSSVKNLLCTHQKTCSNHTCNPQITNLYVFIKKFSIFLLIPVSWGILCGPAQWGLTIRQLWFGSNMGGPNSFPLFRQTQTHSFMTRMFLWGSDRPLANPSV